MKLMRHIVGKVSLRPEHGNGVAVKISPRIAFDVALFMAMTLFAVAIDMAFAP